MRLPNAENAFILGVKLSSYLLSAAHPRGRGKAQFFVSFGFSPASPRDLEQALLQHARDHEVMRIQETEHGTKYEVEGPITAPDGRAPVVKSVWIIDQRDGRPRFVTAMPGRRRPR